MVPRGSDLADGGSQPMEHCRQGGEQGFPPVSHGSKRAGDTLQARAGLHDSGAPLGRQI